MLTKDLHGFELNWAVAKALGIFQTGPAHGDTKALSKVWYDQENGDMFSTMEMAAYNPSENWDQAGEVLDALVMDYGMTLKRSGNQFAASVAGSAEVMLGSTPLIAASRLLVSQRLGNEIDIKEGLLYTPTLHESFCYQITVAAGDHDGKPYGWMITNGVNIGIAVDYHETPQQARDAAIQRIHEKEVANNIWKCPIRDSRDRMVGGMAGHADKDGNAIVMMSDCPKENEHGAITNVLEGFMASRSVKLPNTRFFRVNPDADDDSKLSQLNVVVGFDNAYVRTEVTNSMPLPQEAAYRQLFSAVQDLIPEEKSSSKMKP